MQLSPADWKAMLETPVGKELIVRLINLEISARAEGSRATSVEEKGIAQIKMDAYYFVRTMLDDLSTIKESTTPPGRQKRSGGPKV